jgi:hypothetical protein
MDRLRSDQRRDLRENSTFKALTEHRETPAGAKSDPRSVIRLLQPNYSLTGSTEWIRPEAMDGDHAVFRTKTTRQHPADTAQSNS